MGDDRIFSTKMLLTDQIYFLLSSFFLSFFFLSLFLFSFSSFFLSSFFLFFFFFLFLFFSSFFLFSFFLSFFLFLYYHYIYFILFDSIPFHSHCSGCVFTLCVCTLDGLIAEHKFRVWVTILGHMSHHFHFSLLSLSVYFI